MFSQLLIIQFLVFPSWIESIQVGFISNVIMSSSSVTIVPMNDSCDQCICLMLLENNILSVNCIQNETCLLFHNYSVPYTFNDSPNSSFHFLVLPSEQDYSIEPQITTTTAPSIVKSILWTFDNTLNDLSNQYTDIGYHSPSYYTPGINGYGSALVLNGSIGQCVIVTPYLNMNNISFTWELWMYSKIELTDDSMLIEQCTQSGIVDQCLQILTRNNVIWFVFGNDDVVGCSNISANKWYHIALVYDSEVNQKYIYLNGILEGTHNSTGPLQVISTSLTFGCGTLNGSNSYQKFFTGYIDQVLYNSRIKNASEILDDATLVAYYPFFSTKPLIDSGPNYINGSWSGGSVSIASGIVNQAINFPTNGSYFQITGLVLVGISNWSLSLSLWFKITSLNGGGTIAHLSSKTTGNGWCIGFIGLLANGKVQIQIHINGSVIAVVGPTMSIGIWNHVVHTFSSTNGMRLYVNGTLYGSVATIYAASGVVDTLIFGNPLLGTKCQSLFPNQQFYGSIDQVRFYSRELTAIDISQLYSNP